MSRERRCGAKLALVMLGVLLAGCVSQTEGSRPGAAAPHAAQNGSARGRSETMVSGDESGLGISGGSTPDALRAIVAAPYDVPGPPDCAAMARQIADLDALLGPDVDVLAAPRSNSAAAGQAFGSAVRGAIPYRWVMRLVTQAGRLDRELRQAILAGTARRSYLKGMRQALACPPAPKTAAP